MEQTSNGGRECVYGVGTRNVFTVEVGQAADAAAAKAEWSAAQAKAQAAVDTKLPAGDHVTLDTANAAGIGDQAATAFGTANIAGVTAGFTGIYVIKGATFFGFEDFVIGGTSPAISVMDTEAMTVLGRI